MFNSPLSGSGNKDLIIDFNIADDVIQLENSIMTSIGLTAGAGALAATEFFVGAAAHDANDSIINNRSTGALFYDKDGTGATSAVQIATIGTSSHPALTAVHKELQSQFIRRTIKKRYVAVLDGSIPGESGVIDLPLRVDLDDRPRQMVCYEYGKHARTEWQVVSREAGRTRVHFYPITGRTHQFRVHAAHGKRSGFRTF